MEKLNFLVREMYLRLLDINFEIRFRAVNVVPGKFIKTTLKKTFFLNVHISGPNPLYRFVGILDVGT